MPANIEDIYRRLSVLFLTTATEELPVNEKIQASARSIIEHFGFSMNQSPVTGVALGYDISFDKLAITIFLRESVDGFASYVSESLGLARFPIRQLTTGEIRPTARPAIGGESLGEGAKNGKSGTFGCLVEDASGDKYLLSCNHVLSYLNSGVKGKDKIWQPSDRDGGNSSDEIGVLHDFAPISLDGITMNRIDAAIAKPSQTADVTDGIKKLGLINGTASNFFYGETVEKYGWRTNHTIGTLQYKVSFLQKYPGHGSALFVDQLAIVGTTNDFSSDGDSGSVVINQNNEAIGLIFADAPDVHMTFANPINDVFNYFGISPV